MKHTFTTRSFLAALAALMLLALAGPSWAAVYVNAGGTGGGTSWADAYGDIQTAITASGATAASPVEIYVAKGTYQLSATISLPAGVKLYGGFAGTEATIDLDARDFAANETTLDGGGDKRVIECTDGAARADNTILDGFTIRNGQADHGGGMYIQNASPTVRNCTFSNNTVTSMTKGGGMYIKDGSPTVTNCTFTGNTGTYAGTYGGGMNIDKNASPAVTNCTFSNNTAKSGGGMRINSKPTITNCTFSNNTATDNGGGMHINSNPTITNCTFTSNAATNSGGGMNIYNSSPTVTNCTFSDNTGTKNGSGMYIYGSSASPAITNCTFSSNAATNNGGGMYIYNYASPAVTNCTFVGSTGTEVCADQYSSPRFINTLLWGALVDQVVVQNGGAVSLTNCAGPAGVTGSNLDTGYVEIRGWTPDPHNEPVNGVTHTVYRIEDNAALDRLKRAGTSGSGIPTTDQLGRRRAIPPCIGAVEWAISGVTLDKTAMDLTAGNTETLTPTLAPAGITGTVTWDSTNTAVATVSNGQVTAVAPGTAAITATAGGYTAVCVVTVTPAATGVTLNETFLSLLVGGTRTLTPTLTPTNTTEGISNVAWNSNNAAATVSDAGEVKAEESGNATITATVTTDAGNTFTATCAVTVSIVPIPAQGVTLDQPALTLAENGTGTLTARLTPTNTTERITDTVWTPSNVGVAAVDVNGTVTALKTGTDIITATVATDAGHTFTATCVVTVTPGLVTGVALAPKTLSLIAGGTGTLTATLAPSNATEPVTWKSSDESVAIVAGGTVVGFKAGTATITATAGGYSDICAVTVNPVSIPATDISLNKNTMSLLVNGTEALIATLTPPNATDPVTWKSDDDTIATVSNGTVTAHKAGSATITATAGGKSATCALTVTDGTPTPTPSIYTVTFDAQGGTVSPTSATTDANGKLASLPTPARDGHTFTGWFTAASGGEQVTAATVFTSDATVYARWEATGGGDDPVDPPDVDPDTLAEVISNDGRTLTLRILFDGKPLAEVRLWFWLELISLKKDPQTAAAPQAWLYFGPFEGTTDAEGRLDIDVDDLTWEAGPYKGERAVLPAGEYVVHYVDAETRKKYAGATETPVTLEGTRVVEYGSRSGGCSAGFGGAALMVLALAAVALRRKA